MNGSVYILALGDFEIRHDDRRIGPDGLGGRKPKQLLQLLVAARGHIVPKEHLIDRLWDGQPPQHPVSALENHVWVLRHRLREAAPAAPPLIVTEAEAYRLATDSVTLDLDRFDHLVREAGRQGLAAGRRFLEDALELVRGEVFADEPYSEWAAPLRERYRQEVQGVRLDMAEASLLANDLGSAVTHGSRAAAYEPLSERACQLRMWSLAASGEREGAMRVFDAFRRSLRMELSLDPLPATLTIYEDARAGRIHAGRSFPARGTSGAVATDG